MTSKNCDCADAGRFIAEYSAWLWSCGATCARIDKNARRIAAAFGYNAHITVMPRHVSVMLGNESSGGQRLYAWPVEPCGINFAMNAALSSLSWKISDDRMSLDEATTLFHYITSCNYDSHLKTILLTSLANASFCRLFGGDATAMLVVFIATFVGYTTRILLLARKIDIRIAFYLCALISSVICSAAEVFDWGATPQIALASSVLYLIPGVPYINAANDLIDRHYLCAMSRFTDACVLTAALSCGLCTGIFITGIRYI